MGKSKAPTKEFDEAEAQAEELQEAQAEEAQMSGFGDPILAPTFAAALSSVLGAVAAASKGSIPTGDPGAPKLVRSSNTTSHHGHNATKRWQTFLSSAHPQATSLRSAQPWSQRQRSNAANFF